MNTLKPLRSSLLQIILSSKVGEEKIFGPIVNPTSIQAAVARARQQYGFEGKISQQKIERVDPDTGERKDDTYVITRTA